jgi:LysM repeat protein
MRRFGPIMMVTLALTLSACTRSLSAAPTPNQNSLPTPTTSSLQALLTGAETEDPMAMLQQVATQTAQAQDNQSTPGTPTTTDTLPIAPTVTGSETDLTPGSPSVTESTPESGLPTVTPNLIVVATSTPGHPSTYTLQPGEFPYCIARRFDIDPSELLSLNGLSSGQLYIPGLVLKIPQSGDPFPGTRALRTHPATYTVLADDTIYSIACTFGDVDPLQIAAANGLASPYALQIGQALSIP